MTDKGPMESALEAEEKAKRAVEDAREQAGAIRQEARERARRIERRAEERVKRLHSAVDAELESRRKAIERQGAEALRELKHETIDPESMSTAIKAVVRQLMSEDSGSHGEAPDED